MSLLDKSFLIPYVSKKRLKKIAKPWHDEWAIHAPLIFKNSKVLSLGTNGHCSSDACIVILWQVQTEEGKYAVILDVKEGSCIMCTEGVFGDNVQSFVDSLYVTEDFEEAHAYFRNKKTHRVASSCQLSYIDLHCYCTACNKKQACKMYDRCCNNCDFSVFEQYNEQFNIFQSR